MPKNDMIEDTQFSRTKVDGGEVTRPGGIDGGRIIPSVLLESSIEPKCFRLKCEASNLVDFNKFE